MTFLTKYIPYYKRNLHLAIPIILSQVGQVLVGLVDTKMIGKVGTTELAASAFANNIFNVAMVLGMGIALGMTPLVGKAFGKRDDHGVKELFASGMLLNLVSGIVLTLVMLGVIPFMHLMGQPEQVVRLAYSYYFILALSMIPLVLFFSFKQFLEGVNNTIISMVVTFAGVITNIGLNYIFIYGKLGCPELGLDGAGIATLIARILMPIVITIYFLQHIDLKQYIKALNIKHINKVKVKNLFYTGLPIGGQILIEVSAFNLGGIMMGWFGEVPLAANQVAIGLGSVSFMIAMGIASSTTIQISHLLGKKNFREMRQAAFASLHIVIVVMSLAALSFVLFGYEFAALFSDDTEVIKVSVSLLLMTAIFQLFDGIQAVSLGILRGIADVKKPMVYAFISYTIVVLPISYICAFPLNIGPIGIWIGLICGLATAATLFVLRLMKKNKQLTIY